MSLLPLLCLLTLPVFDAVITNTMEVQASGLMRRQSKDEAHEDDEDEDQDEDLGKELGKELGEELGLVFSSREIECDTNLDTNTSKNVVRGLDPNVTSECGTSGGKRGKQFLTDGQTRKRNRRDMKYWISCADDDAPAATLTFSEVCVHRVRIWSRPNCCGAQMAGVLAKVWDGEAWHQCGESSTNVGKQSAFTFSCAIKGSKLKLTRADGSSGRISISEVQLFPAVQPPFCMAGEIDTGTNLVLDKTPSVSSDCSMIGSSSKSYLTDGELQSNNKKYWRSCQANNPWAKVTFASSCVRQVKIWARDFTQTFTAGIKAEVRRGSDWTQCGSTAPDIGKGESHTFECNLIGTAIRLRKECNNCRIHLREMKVFSNA